MTKAILKDVRTEEIFYIPLEDSEDFIEHYNRPMDLIDLGTTND